MKDEFARLDTEILGASFDTPEANAAFARKYDFNFPLVCDITRQIGTSYGACDEPDAIFARRISYVIGPDGRIKHVYAKVDPASHPRQVLDELIADQRTAA